MTGCRYLVGRIETFLTLRDLKNLDNLDPAVKPRDDEALQAAG